MTTFGFVFVVSAPSPNRIETIEDALEQASEDARLDLVGGRWLLTVYIDGSDILSAFEDTLGAIDRAAAELRVIRLDDDLVAVSDIASRIGVSRQAVQQFVSLDGFPPPWSTVASARVWRWAEVNEWLRGNRADRADAEYWPLAEDAAKINAAIVERQQSLVFRPTVTPVPAWTGLWVASIPTRLPIDRSRKAFRDALFGEAGRVHEWNLHLEDPRGESTGSGEAARRV